MSTTLQLTAALLIAFACGAASIYFLRYIIERFASRRAKRHFVRFVQPQTIGKSAAPLSDAEIETVGGLIHQVLRQQENECETMSLNQLPLLGQKAPRCHEMTGRVLALLDTFSSCAWGCAEADHILERLVARSVNHARAAIRLSSMGFYDEALVLTRGVGEIANLLSLFETRPETFKHWKSLDDRARRKNYSPVHVRTQLAETGTPIQVTAEVYAELSQRNVHVSPRTSPQTYDTSGRPKSGGYYQETGLMICQNELAQALTFVIYSAAKLSHLESPRKKTMLMAGRDLILNTGSLGLENLQQIWAEYAREAAAATSTKASN